MGKACSGGRRCASSRFTLVEGMVAITLALVVLAGAGSVHLSTGRSFADGSRRLLAQREATSLANEIHRKVRPASAFRIHQLPDRDVPPASGDSLVLFDRAGARNPRGPNDCARPPPDAHDAQNALA